jgi:hypothetical protein
MSVMFRSNVSRSRAYILALAAKGPQNLTNGARIDPAVALSSYNKKQFHHVYPRAYLKRQEIKNDNLLINICMLAAAGNLAVSDDDPHVYLPELAKRLGDNADAVFASNLLPIPSMFDYATASYTEFLNSRTIIARDFVAQLCRGLSH